MASTRRQQLERQRASWMQQHKQQLQHQQVSPARTKTVADSVAAAERPPVIDSSSRDYDCPICSRLMFGPDQVPTVLFPCGHTFCRACLDRACRPKCPFCREPIQSRAVNVPLQAMIERCGGISRRPDTADGAAQRYLDEFRALSMKKRALIVERRSARERLQGSDAEHGRRAAIEAQLSADHDRLIAEITRLQLELEQVDSERRRNVDALHQAELDQKRNGAELDALDAQLRPLQVGIDKSRLLFYNFRPGAVLSSDDDDD